MENDMIRISQIKLTPDANKEALTKAAAKLCHVQMTDISLVIRKKSLDCRKNHPVKYVYTVDVTFRNPQLEEKVWKKNKNANITKSTEDISATNTKRFWNIKEHMNIALLLWEVDQQVCFVHICWH